MLSGLAFISIYLQPCKKLSKLFSVIFSPLDFLSAKFMLFSKIYNSYHSLCYRIFVGDYKVDQNDKEE